MMVDSLKQPVVNKSFNLYIEESAFLKPKEWKAVSFATNNNGNFSVTFQTKQGSHIHIGPISDQYVHLWSGGAIFDFDIKADTVVDKTK